MHQTLPVAVRSLQCPDHADNIPPKILSVLWNIGKRCNFDCSYCSPHTHDAISPFLDITQAEVFVNNVEKYCYQRDRQIKWGFTGGEPFVDPGFMMLIQRVRNLSHTHQINVTTNGSAPISTYSRAAKMLDGITVSLHFERSTKEIQDILDKLPHMQKDCYVSVNVMFLPGTRQRVENTVVWLQDRNIPFVVHKITPADSNAFSPFQIMHDSRKSRTLIDLNQQVLRKNQNKSYNISTRQQRLMNFYSPDDLNFLEQINDKHDWVNCGVWYDDGTYQERNSDYLLARDLTNFQGWICYAGVDCLYVDFDGSIYRAMCLNDGVVGHISDNICFLDQPTRCQRHWCTCNTDIATRKALSSAISLING